MSYFWSKVWHAVDFNIQITVITSESVWDNTSLSNFRLRGYCRVCKTTWWHPGDLWLLGENMYFSIGWQVVSLSEICHISMLHQKPSCDCFGWDQSVTVILSLHGRWQLLPVCNQFHMGTPSNLVQAFNNRSGNTKYTLLPSSWLPGVTDWSLSPWEALAINFIATASNLQQLVAEYNCFPYWLQACVTGAIAN